MKNENKSPGVAEIQGLYGPLQVLEGKVQQIWAQQRLQRGNWRTRAGRRLLVLDPGRWNHGRGPDFREARIELDGEVRCGDVEMHLYREDWWRHGHDRDPAFNGVILHVVVFSGGMDRPLRTAAGRSPEEWVMGPWLREDLESVAGGAPGLYGELSPELREWMEGDTPEAVRERLRIGADRRWRNKETTARILYEAHGWSGGLHRLTLLTLGFPANRRSFYEMAERYPLPEWRGEVLWPALKGEWGERVDWSHGRPANRAEKRLRQYIALNRQVPDWPEKLAGLPGMMTPFLDRLASVEEVSTRTVRRTGGLAEWRRRLLEEVCGKQLNPGMVDRFFIDSGLPMLSVAGRLAAPLAALLWFHHPPGWFPDGVRPLFKLVAIQFRKGYPLCNGWVQGLLWAEEQLRLERIRSWTRTGPMDRPA